MADPQQPAAPQASAPDVNAPIDPKDLPRYRENLARYLQSPGYQNLPPKMKDAVRTRIGERLRAVQPPTVTAPPKGVARGKEFGYNVLEKGLDIFPATGATVGGLMGEAAIPFVGPGAFLTEAAGAGLGGMVGAGLRDQIRQQLGWAPRGQSLRAHRGQRRQ